jgi:hypothetical protein
VNNETEIGFQDKSRTNFTRGLIVASTPIPSQGKSVITNQEAALRFSWQKELLEWSQSCRNLSEMVGSEISVSTLPTRYKCFQFSDFLITQKAYSS